MKIHTIPLHLGDWLGGTLGMDATECGAYFNLIAAHYTIGEDGLPNNDSELARLARCTPKVWARIGERIKSKFSQNGSKIVHERTLLEIQKMLRKSTENRANALKRHNKHDATALNSQSDGNAIQNPESRIQNPINNKLYKLVRPVTADEVRSAKKGDVGYDPLLIDCDILPDGWFKFAEDAGLDERVILNKFRFMRERHPKPLDRSHWVNIVNYKGNGYAKSL
jgi:uncharacterized protein YdaU (DUF1376 family)